MVGWVVCWWLVGGWVNMGGWLGECKRWLGGWWCLVVGEKFGV